MATDIDLSVLEQFIAEQKKKLQKEKELLNIENTEVPVNQKPTISSQPEPVHNIEQQPEINTLALVQKSHDSSDDAGFFDQMGNSVQSRREKMQEEMQKDMQNFLEKQRQNKHPRLKQVGEVTHSPLSNTDL